MKKAKKPVGPAKAKSFFPPAKKGELLERDPEPLSAEEAKAVERMMKHIKAKQALRQELGGGDDSHYRAWLELYQESGIPVHVLRSMPASEVTKLLAATIRKRRATKPLPEDSKNFVRVLSQYCYPNRTTLNRHTKHPKHKHKIRPTENEKGFWIHRDYLHEYVYPKHIKDYLTD